MSLPYQQFYWGDYHRDTVGLKAAEHGAYLLLIGALWNGGGSLPDDEELLCRIACCTPRQWPKVWAVIRRFFEFRSNAQGSWIEHRRVSADLDRADAKREHRSNAGKRGASERWNKNKEGPMANAWQTHGKPLPDTNITTFPSTTARGRLSVVHSADRRTLEHLAAMEAANASRSAPPDDV